MPVSAVHAVPAHPGVPAVPVLLGVPEVLAISFLPAVSEVPAIPAVRAIPAVPALPEVPTDGLVGGLLEAEGGLLGNLLFKFEMGVTQNKWLIIRLTNHNSQFNYRILFSEIN